MKKLPLLLTLFLLALPALACNLFSGAEPTAVSPTSSAINIPTPLSPPPTMEIAATNTPPPETATATATAAVTALGTAVCSYATRFLADVTIPDDSQILANSAFSKTWRIRNSGSCPLPEGSVWAFTEGERMSGNFSYPLPTLGVSETADISINLVAPTAPGTYTGYWQVRLPDGRILPTRYYVRIIVPAPTPTASPTATPTPTPSPTPGNAPVILYFRANVAQANPGDTIQLEWDTKNADTVTIYRLIGGQLSNFWQHGPRGSMNYAIDPSERNSISFALYATRQTASSTASATLEIPLTCPNPWFFAPAPAECAAQNAIISAGAEQRFERGVMIWVQGLDRIFVLYDGPDANGEWNSFTDEWNEGDPIDDPGIVPPSGFYQPGRGFGLVWRTQPDVRNRLGWAIAPEAALTTAYQTTARFRYNEAFIRALDGNVWRLLPERSGWEKIIVQGG